MHRYRAAGLLALGSFDPRFATEDPEFGLRLWAAGRRLGISKRSRAGASARFLWPPVSACGQFRRTAESDGAQRVGSAGLEARAW